MSLSLLLTGSIALLDGCSRKDKLLGHLALFSGHTPAMPLHVMDSVLPVGTPLTPRQGASGLTRIRDGTSGQQGSASDAVGSGGDRRHLTGGQATGDTSGVQVDVQVVSDNERMLHTFAGQSLGLNPGWNQNSDLGPPEGSGGGALPEDDGERGAEERGVLGGALFRSLFPTSTYPGP